MPEFVNEQLLSEVELFLEENCPKDPSKWSYYKSQAKKKFDVYPSAYANAWAAKQYKGAGGGWKKCAKKESVNEAKSVTLITYGGREIKYKNSDINNFIRNLDLNAEDLPGLIYKASMRNPNIINTRAKSYDKKKEAILKLLKKIKSHSGDVIIDLDSKNPSFKHTVRFGLPESVNESNETYFKSFTNAAEAARAYALKKGYDVDEDDWQSQVAFGGRYGRGRPSVGKTHSFSVGLLRNGKPQRKALHFSVYGMESGNFELTAYIN